MTERFMIDDAGTLIDMNTRNTYDYVTDVVTVLNELNDTVKELTYENTQLDIFITNNHLAYIDLERKNKNLTKQLDYIQNSITEHIKHQKTELGQKALQEVIKDYNEWMLGHKELKE